MSKPMSEMTGSELRYLIRKAQRMGQKFLEQSGIDCWRQYGHMMRLIDRLNIFVDQLNGNSQPMG